MDHLNRWHEKISPLIQRKNITTSSHITSKFIIEYTGQKYGQLLSICEANRGRVYREISLIPSFAAELPHSCLEELIRCHTVRKIWLDLPVSICLDISVPATGAAIPHNQGISGKGMVVAIIDTGIYPHPDLTTPENRITGWLDLVGQRAQPYDDNGHGTHVAGIVAGNGAASQGKYSGMAPQANLVGVKVLDKYGGGDISTVIAGVEWCLTKQLALNIKVINLSLGATAQESYHSDPLCRATSLAIQNGIVVCTAAGNEGPEIGSINTPGINPNAITVGNSNDQETISSDDDRLNDSSSRGPTLDAISKPDILAPGTGITSLWINGKYRSLTGTSMATPMIAGATALILEKFPSLTAAQVKQKLLDHAKSLGLEPNLQGAGLLNLENIFTAVPN